MVRLRTRDMSWRVRQASDRDCLRRLTIRLALVVLCVGVIGVSPGFCQLRPEAGTVEQVTPALVDKLRSDAFAYFRFVNRPWTARVCEVFAGELRDLPVVRLHGDAHLEQFALTDDAWGLDDFDDAARGPALVDIVRMLGSIDLGTRLRGWTQDRESLFDRFFQGYRRGLSEPDYLPPQPAIVGHLRPQAVRSREAFLAWGDAQMEPMTNAEMTSIISSVEIFARVTRREQADLAPGYLQVVRAGWLRLGVGSALSRKILIRLQGPSPDPADDELVEAKELQHLDGLPCLEDPPPQPTLRVIGGTRYLGRIKHKILAAGPEFLLPERFVGAHQLKDWWIRSWHPSYREVRLNDLRSVQDLAEIVYDAGLQLGAGSLRGDADARGTRGKLALASVTKLEKRMRTEASNLVEQLLLGWREFGGR
jgi:Uncharacterized protein conserved in bacteria (DUF2252)